MTGGQTGAGGETRPEVSLLLKELAAKPPGASIWIPKSRMPKLPPEFHETALGTPLWIAHPGAVSQYRAASALHAYELDAGWKVHRDSIDPEQNPVGHVFLRRPRTPLGGPPRRPGWNTDVLVPRSTRTGEGRGESTTLVSRSRRGRRRTRGRPHRLPPCGLRPSFFRGWLTARPSPGRAEFVTASVTPSSESSGRLRLLELPDEEGTARQSAR